MTGNGSGGTPAQTSGDTQIAQVAALGQQASSTSQDVASTAIQTNAQPQPTDGGGSNAGGMFGTGQAGVLRLFQSGLASQVSWLLPFGLMSIVAMACSVSWRRSVPSHALCYNS